MKILDIVQQAKNQPAIYAGKYTWALADSTHRIIYQKNDLNLVEAGKLPKPQRAQADNVDPAQPSSIENISITNHSASRGRVFFIGNFSNDRYQNAVIYINNRPWGILQKFLEQGIYLRPGRYRFSIRDDSGAVLKDKSNIRVLAGKTIPVEF